MEKDTSFNERIISIKGNIANELISHPSFGRYLSVIETNLEHVFNGQTYCKMEIQDDGKTIIFTRELKRGVGKIGDANDNLYYAKLSLDSSGNLIFEDARGLCYDIENQKYLCMNYDSNSGNMSGYRSDIVEFQKKLDAGYHTTMSLAYTSAMSDSKGIEMFNGVFRDSLDFREDHRDIELGAQLLTPLHRPKFFHRYGNIKFPIFCVNADCSLQYRRNSGLVDYTTYDAITGGGITAHIGTTKNSIYYSNNEHPYGELRRFGKIGEMKNGSVILTDDIKSSEKTFEEIALEARIDYEKALANNAPYNYGFDEVTTSKQM